MRSSSSEQRSNVAVFVAIALIGGGNAVGVAIAVHELDPLWAAAVRFLAAGLLFAAFMAACRVPIPSGGALIGALIYGVFAFAGAYALLFWGLRETPPGTAQIIIAVIPLLTLVFAVAHGLERLSLRAVGGSLTALSGLALLVSDRVSADVPLLSLLAVIGGAAFLAESGVVVKLTPRAHPLASNAVGMLGGGLILLAISAVVGDAWLLPTRSDTWTAMVFLVLGGSVAVFGLYIFLLGRWSASSTSYTLLLMPIATVVYSALLTGEPMTPALLVGGAVIIGGVWIGAFAKTSRATSSE
ncbi:MAG: DMT family transporter [Candidatus Limnocylindria bacterium]